MENKLKSKCLWRNISVWRPENTWRVISGWAFCAALGSRKDSKLKSQSSVPFPLLASAERRIFPMNYLKIRFKVQFQFHFHLDPQNSVLIWKKRQQEQWRFQHWGCFIMDFILHPSPSSTLHQEKPGISFPLWRKKGIKISAAGAGRFISHKSADLSGVAQPSCSPGHEGTASSRELERKTNKTPGKDKMWSPDTHLLLNHLGVLSRSRLCSRQTAPQLLLLAADARACPRQPKFMNIIQNKAFQNRRADLCVLSDSSEGEKHMEKGWRMVSALRVYQPFQAALNILNLVLKGKMFPYRILCPSYGEKS